MKVLKDHQDPRVMGDGSTFDKPPFTGVEPNLEERQGRKVLKKVDGTK